MNYLSIEIAEEAVCFSSIRGESSQKHHFFFNDRKDHAVKNQLETFLLDSGIAHESFDEYLVSWSSKQTTLVPANVFTETTPSDIIKLCFGNQITSNDIDYNRLAEIGLVNVFYIPLWVKSFFVIKYPRAIIQHEATHILRGIFAGSTFKLKTVLVVYQTYFLVCIVKENKLQFYSVFDFQQVEDIVYHLMFTLQQKAYAKEPMTMQVCPGVGSSAALIEELTAALREFPSTTNNSIQVDSNFIINSQQLCV